MESKVKSSIDRTKANLEKFMLGVISNESGNLSVDVKGVQKNVEQKILEIEKRREHVRAEWSQLMIEDDSTDSEEEKLVFSNKKIKEIIVSLEDYIAEYRDKGNFLSKLIKEGEGIANLLSRGDKDSSLNISRISNITAKKSESAKTEEELRGMV